MAGSGIWSKRRFADIISNTSWQGKNNSYYGQKENSQNMPMIGKTDRHFSADEQSELTEKDGNKSAEGVALCPSESARFLTECQKS